MRNDRDRPDSTTLPEPTRTPNLPTDPRGRRTADYQSAAVRSRSGCDPRQWVNDVEAAAHWPGLSSSLLAAQLQQESSFSPDVTSSAGAQGIAQFMPGTWLTYGVDADGGGQASVDPEGAITAQGRLMRELMRPARSSGFGGDPVALALAGYNAGWVPSARTAVCRRTPRPRTFADDPRHRPDRYRRGRRRCRPPDRPRVVLTRCRLRSERRPVGERPHRIGLRASCGTPVVAVTSGVAVISTAEALYAGPHHVKVTAADGTETWYAHMPAATVRSGQTVRVAQQIGYVGAEGNTTGCHLHLAVRPGNRPVDPIKSLQ